MYKALIFDFDGVIVNGIPFHDEAYIKTFEGIGLDITIEHLHTKIGLTVKEVISSILRDKNVEADIPKLVQNHHELLVDLYNTKSYITSDIKPFIETCIENNLKLALASSTSSDILNMVLDKFSLHRYFSAVIGGEQVSKGKPNPEMLLKALTEISVNSQETIAIDDARSGILASKEIGMYSIAYLKYSKINILEANTNVFDFKDIDFKKIL
jgi:HAD superfamily hydrolase (TIGR01509 family)